MYYDERHRHKVETAAAQYIPQYIEIVKSTLLPAQNFDELICFFNKNFPFSQSLEKWKTHPDSLKDGKVTCDMAAILVSYWWYLKNQILSVTARHRCDRSAAPHYAVGTPLSTNTTPDQHIETYHQQRILYQNEALASSNHLAIVWLHWLKNTGLQPIGKNQNGVMTSPGNVTTKMQEPNNLAQSIIRSHKLPATEKSVSIPKQNLELVYR